MLRMILVKSVPGTRKDSKSVSNPKELKVLRITSKARILFSEPDHRFGNWESLSKKDCIKNYTNSLNKGYGLREIKFVVFTNNIQIIPSLYEHLNRYQHHEPHISKDDPVEQNFSYLLLLRAGLDLCFLHEQQP